MDASFFGAKNFRLLENCSTIPLFQSRPKTAGQSIVAISSRCSVLVLVLTALTGARAMAEDPDQMQCVSAHSRSSGQI